MVDCFTFSKGRCGKVAGCTQYIRSKRRSRFFQKGTKVCTVRLKGKIEQLIEWPKTGPLLHGFSIWPISGLYPWDYLPRRVGRNLQQGSLYL
jgi:hypothetical protein